MRAVVQRVKEAEVRVDGAKVSSIGKGLLVLLGVEKEDTEKDLKWMLDKVLGLRVFEDERGKMNLSVREVGGELLVVSNFTVCGDCRRGKRPSFDPAEEPQRARELYEEFVKRAREAGVSVKTGVFGEFMEVFLVNQGPVTLLLDSRKRI